MKEEDRLLWNGFVWEEPKEGTHDNPNAELLYCPYYLKKQNTILNNCKIFVHVYVHAILLCFL